MNEPLLVECARWIYAHKDEPDWWTPYVLTDHNPNDNPNVNIDQAYDVFAELKRRRLMVHTIARINNQAFPAFKINSTKDDEWKKLIAKQGPWKLWIIPVSIWLLKKTWLLLLFICGILLTKYLEIMVEHRTESVPTVSKHNVQINESQLNKLLQSIEKGMNQPHTSEESQTQDSGTNGHP